ncbi:hypothetical protein D9M68_794810 [compost metagenome]
MAIEDGNGYQITSAALSIAAEGFAVAEYTSYCPPSTSRLTGARACIAQWNGRTRQSNGTVLDQGPPGAHRCPIVRDAQASPTAPRAARRRARLASYILRAIAVGALRPAGLSSTEFPYGLLAPRPRYRGLRARLVFDLVKL